MHASNYQATASDEVAKTQHEKLLDFAVGKPRRLLRRIYATARVALDQNVIIAQWANFGRVKHNWGDALNPVLIKLLSGRNPVHKDLMYNVTNKPVYTVIGSGLGNQAPNAIIWGTGFIDSRDRLRVKPRSICAVRGPLTRMKIMESGIDCPEVYGDPALLYPLFYRPSLEKRFELGIVPHCFDQDSPLLNKFRDDPSIAIIDITAGINAVVDQLNSCKLIASDSLHGLIAADAYGIPSTWIKLSDKPLGDDFKFRDYLASVGRKDHEPLTMTTTTSRDQILDRIRVDKLDIDLAALLSACPFLDPAVKTAVTREWPH